MAIYAKVVDRIITEYPITEGEYNIRFEEFDIVECFENKKPVFDPVSEYLIDEPYILAETSDGPLVIINYTKKKYTFEELLSKMSLLNPTVVSDIPPDLLNAIVTSVKERVQENLDAFAKTRDYNSIRSAITYKTSTVPQFATEAARCELLRDTTWNNLNTYLTDLMNGTAPLPTSWIDIESHLPALTWI